MEPFIAQIIMFGGNFAPRGWAFCDGQLLPISQNTALFSLLGTTYGGDGRTSFALPDLRGRVPIGPRHGPGLSPVKLGERGGTETNTLTITTLPNHNHTASVTGMTAAFSNGVGTIPVNSEEGLADEKNPAGGVLNNAEADIYTSEAANAVYGANVAVTGDVAITGGNITVGNTGGQQPVNNMQPFLGINYIIALEGIFPSRS
ncbi:tail fiber protein [Polaribacter sp. Z014]|uniref:phage tail protein n=1 Tax=unclassified Polaribacter TaxID=196858 RepID=UPI00193B36A2|nr:MULTISPECIES: tail fiber protein [unclassified Polaribacter]MCL7764790.1 tail fiber protein [Polaribacter sp. Z014]QVY64849.1 phage tail protein [Polaribacter sp. Q13]